MAFPAGSWEAQLMASLTDTQRVAQPITQTAMVLRSGQVLQPPKTVRTGRVKKKGAKNSVKAASKNSVKPQARQCSKLSDLIMDIVMQKVENDKPPRKLQPHEIFPFMDLPPEVRNMIYALCISTDGINKFLVDYWRKIKHVTEIKDVSIPPVNKYTPPFLLVSRRCYVEARAFTNKQSVTFTHGMLDLANITSLAPPALFRNLGSIEINDSGHPTMFNNLSSVIIHGYTNLLHELSSILAKGHNLKKFKFTLKAAKLSIHLNRCWNRKTQCGYRNLVRDALNSLRAVRGIKEVTFGGVLPVQFCAHLKQWMEGQPHSFMDFPLTIRNLIYEHTLDWNDVTPRLTKLKDVTNTTALLAIKRFEVPGLFHTNRKINEEAMEVLESKPLTITFPKFDNPPVPHLTDIAPIQVLQSVRNLKLVFTSMSFTSQVPYIVAILKHSKIQSLNIEFNDPGKALVVEQTGFYPDVKAHRAFSELAKLAGCLQAASISGSLPRSYAQPLCDIMTHPISTRRNKSSAPDICVQGQDGLIIPANQFFSDPNYYRGKAPIYRQD